MTTNRTTETPDQFDGYLPAVLLPESRPGPIERLLTVPFRREWAARMESK